MSAKKSSSKSPKKLAKWLRFYDIFAYIIFSIDFLYALGYISYISIIINDWKMYLPFEPSRAWLELNAYSLLPSFCTIPAAPLLVWQVGARVELSSGDFYGIVGSMLGLGAISLFDACKTLILYLDHDRSDCSALESTALRIAMQTNVAGDTYIDWQYKLFITKNGETVEIVHEHNKDGYRIDTQTGPVFAASPDNRTLPLGGSWIPPYTGDKGVRWWTHLIQKDLKCCGSETYKEWDIFNGDIYSDGNDAKYKAKYGNYPPSCYCNFECPRDEIDKEKCFEKCGNSAASPHKERLESRPGCCAKYLNLLYDIYLVTFVLTLILFWLYCVTICVYIINFAATRTGSDIRTQHDPTLTLIESDNDEDYFHFQGRSNSKKLLKTAHSGNKIRATGQYHVKGDRGKLLSTTSAINNAGRHLSDAGGLRQATSDPAFTNKRKATLISS